MTPPVSVGTYWGEEASVCLTQDLLVPWTHSEILGVGLEWIYLAIGRTRTLVS